MSSQSTLKPALRCRSGRLAGRLPYARVRPTMQALLLLLCCGGCAAERQNDAGSAAPIATGASPGPAVAARRVADTTGDARIVVPAAIDLEAHAATARAHLAQQLGVDLSAVTVTAKQLVTWPNGGLGCPQPGAIYTQMLVEGYLLKLQAAGRSYHYHGAAGGEPAYCANPGSRGNLTPQR